MIGKIFVTSSSKEQIPRITFEKIEKISIENNIQLSVTINNKIIVFPPKLDPLNKHLKSILFKLVEEFKDKEFVEEKDIINSKTIKDLKK